MNDTEQKQKIIAHKIDQLGFNSKALKDPDIYIKARSLINNIENDKKLDELLAKKLIVFFIFLSIFSIAAFKFFIM